METPINTQLSQQLLDTIVESLILYKKWNEGFSRVAVTQNDYEASARHIINANNAERALAELGQQGDK
jgi:hypothetical protein